MELIKNRNNTIKIDTLIINNNNDYLSVIAIKNKYKDTTIDNMEITITIQTQIWEYFWSARKQ